MLLKSFLCLLVFAFTSSAEVTFNNVVIQVFSMFRHKYNVSIQSSNTLNEYLQKGVAFDKIEITDSQIPVLYPKSISNIDDLGELILINDNINEIKPGAFQNVPQLRKLVIRNNPQFEDIEEGVFNKLNIATLDLSNNSLNTISPGAFDNMPELLNINLADNKLMVYNKNWFSNTPLLSRVSLQNNLIKELPDSVFQNLRGEKQFGSVSLTINIVLSNNKINTIHEDAFKGLKKINNLWLDGNEIDNWNENLLSHIEIKDLRLENNKIKCLNGNLDKIFVAKATHIDGNPWDCGCVKNIDAWASNQNKEVYRFYAKLTCDAERIDKKIKNLQEYLKKSKRQ